MLPQEKLDLILRRHAEISARLNDGAGARALRRPVARTGRNSTRSRRAIRAYRTQSAETAGLAAMLEDPSPDAEMRSLAEEELRAAELRLETLEQQLKHRAVAEGRGGREKRHP